MIHWLAAESEKIYDFLKAFLVAAVAGLGTVCTGVVAGFGWLKAENAGLKKTIKDERKKSDKLFRELIEVKNETDKLKKKSEEETNEKGKEE